MQLLARSPSYSYECHHCQKKAYTIDTSNRKNLRWNTNSAHRQRYQKAVPSVPQLTMIHTVS